MLANLAISLIEHKRLKTTLAKAKALRVYVEPLITKSKSDTTHSRRVVFSYLNSKEAVKELFGEVAEAVASRPGGYTRILKLGPRSGDNAEMALIELVDFNEFGAGKADSGRKKKRRRRGKKKSGAASGVVANVVEEVKEVAEDVGEFVEEAVDKVEDVVEDVVDKVEDVVEDVVDKVEDVVEDIKDKVEDIFEDAEAEEVADSDDSDDEDDDDKKEDKG